MNQKEQELLPCPFCGQPPNVYVDMPFCETRGCAIDGLWVPTEAWNRRAPQQSAALSRDSIIQAVARGWCKPETSGEVMNPVLALAIADEIVSLLTAAPAPKMKP